MKNPRARTTHGALPWLLAAVGCLWAPPSAHAQERGEPAAVWGGAALGALSGVGLGLLGGAPPCTLALDGATCARITVAVAGTIGAAGGAVLAHHDPGALRGRVLGAGVGALAGAALGLGVRAALPQLGARDVATVAAAGAAVGAAPRGAAVGLGAGLLAGAILWAAFPEAGLPETVALGVVGMALGGVMEWAWIAASERGDPVPVVLRMSVGL